jgi:hypothetical protein
MLFFEISQFEQQCGNVVPDDAPQGVVIDAKISVDQPVARGDDEPPWNLRICRTYDIRNMRCRLAGQFKITYRGVII